MGHLVELTLDVFSQASEAAAAASAPALASSFSAAADATNSARSAAGVSPCSCSLGDLGWAEVVIPLCAPAAVRPMKLVTRLKPSGPLRCPSAGGVGAVLGVGPEAAPGATQNAGRALGACVAAGLPEAGGGATATRVACSHH